MPAKRSDFGVQQAFNVQRSTRNVQRSDFAISIFAAALLAACSPEKPAGAKGNRPLPLAGAPVAATGGVATLMPKAMTPSETLELSGGSRGGDMPSGAMLRRTPVVEAVAKVSGTVVNLGTERTVETRYAIPLLAMRASQLDPFYRQQQVVLVPLPPQRKTTRSLGSGVIVDENGYILTNNHVIDRATRVQVALEGGEVFDASLVAADEMDDLALIRIPLPPGKKLKAVELVDGDEMLLGETVIAMGNPFGLSHSISVGVLSSTNRPATHQGEVLYQDILQTDAAVNPGSSGGPLLNIEGKLLGLNVSVFENAQSIGFAQPAHRVRKFLERWLSPQILKKQWLGFSVTGERGGVRVDAVAEKSPAAVSGLRPGAVISAINGEPVPDLLTFNRRVLALSTGATVTVTWTLDGGTRTTDLAAEPLRFDDGNELAWKHLGMKFKPSVDKSVVPLRYEGSLPVAQVAQIGPAARAGLTPGRYIWKINDTNIHDLSDVSRALHAIRKGDTVNVGIVNFVETQQNIVAHQTYTQLVAD